MSHHPLHRNKDNVTTDNAGMNQPSDQNNPAYGADTGGPVRHQQAGDNTQAYTNQDTSPMTSQHHQSVPPQQSQAGATGARVDSGAGTTATEPRQGEYIATDTTVPVNQGRYSDTSKPQPDAPVQSAPGTTGADIIGTNTGPSSTTREALGKVEQGAGTLLSSQTLKAKGDAKVAEAETMRGQRIDPRLAEGMSTDAPLSRERTKIRATGGYAHGGTTRSSDAGEYPDVEGTPAAGQTRR